MPTNSPKHFPVIASVASQPDLAQELRDLRKMIYSLEERHNAQAAGSVTLTAQQIKQVRDALSAGGTHPLNVNGLLGILTQTQP